MATQGPIVDLDKIEARANATTPGPWHSDETPRGGYNYHGGWYGIGVQVRLNASSEIAMSAHGPDASFIAAAREDVPALIARVRHLEAALVNIIAADENDTEMSEIASAALDGHKLEEVTFERARRKFAEQAETRVCELAAEVRDAKSMLLEIGGESDDLRDLLRNYITVSKRWFNQWRNAEIEIKRRDLGLSENGG